MNARCFVLCALALAAQAGRAATNPYERQLDRHLAVLRSGAAPLRARAAEALGFLRAYRAQPALVERLRDDAPAVRRNAALALAWCGGRHAVQPLLAARHAPTWKIAFAVVVLAVIFYRHWENIKRLFSGKEPLIRQ